MFITLIKLCRVHQWTKNGLLFIPMILAHLFSGPIVLTLCRATFAFCLLTSATYIINDLLDKKSDQNHPIKKYRPIAANKIKTSSAIFICVSLMIGTIILSWNLPHAFYLSLIAYLVISLSYSLILKRVAMLDVLVLALSYSMRIILGGAAINVSLSFWIMTFSVFWFLSLGIIKRIVDLQQMGETGQYHQEDISFLRQIGLSSGFSAIIVAALYINSTQVLKYYNQIHFLWGGLMILLFFLLHIWFALHKKKIKGDPIVFVLKDKVSWMMGLLLFLTGWISI